MNHAKKAITVLSATILLLIIASPMLIAPADAASVLEKETTANASIGEAFEILARGRGGFRTESIEDFKANYVTQMKLHFLFSRRVERGVVLDVLDGSFSMNETSFTFDTGLGIAGRPTQGTDNGTIVFGFRINMTSSSNATAQLEFVGRVKRTQYFGPVLIMKGRLTIDGQIFVFGQIGRIHRL